MTETVLDETQGSEITVDEKGKFVFRQCRAMLTYKTHLDKEAYKAWFVEKVQRDLKFFRMAHEKGDKSHPYLHTHVIFFVSGKPLETKIARYFDYGVDPDDPTKQIHPNIWRFAKGEKHYRNCISYLAKEDPANIDLKDGLRRRVHGMNVLPNVNHLMKQCVRRISLETLQELR